MLSELSVSSSSLDFTNSNYNYDNTNTNVSSHLCNNCNIDLANMAKNNNESMSAGTSRERDLLKAKAMKNLKDGYIELIYETGWKRPIQAYSRKKFHGKIKTYHFFSEWNTFEEAIEWLKHAHKCPIIINTQIGIGI